MFPRIRTQFRWTGSHSGAESKVLVTGDFNGWGEPEVLHLNQSCNEFQLDLVLPPGQNYHFPSPLFSNLLVPGTYMYKFKVDGCWESAPGLPTLTNADGITNNMITVANSFELS
jgi:hypothetical protein